ncbi:hypothetical protein ACUXPL_001424 [Micrococcus sp. 140720015-1]
MNRAARSAAAFIAAAALALTGCGAQVSSSADRPSTGAASSARTWDPAIWTATEKIDQRVTDEAERERWYQDLRARHANGLGLDDPPPVTRRGWATSVEEHERWVSQCMTERGIPAAYSEVRGGLSWDTPPESQQEAVNLAFWTCSFTFPVDPSISQDWSEAQLRLVYDYWDQYAIPCLEDHGITVDTSTRPSKESFVTAFHTQDRHLWWPVTDSLIGLSDSRYAEVVAACPELPSDAVLYGFDG